MQGCADATIAYRHWQVMIFAADRRPIDFFERPVATAGRQFVSVDLHEIPGPFGRLGFQQIHAAAPRVLLNRDIGRLGERPDERIRDGGLGCLPAGYDRQGICVGRPRGEQRHSGQYYASKHEASGPGSRSAAGRYSPARFSATTRINAAARACFRAPEPGPDPAARARAMTRGSYPPEALPRKRRPFCRHPIALDAPR